MIALVRVDNRLIHGQVVEAWLPYLKVQRVVVADDEAAQSPLIRAAMGLAIQDSVEVKIEPLSAVDFRALSSDPTKTLLLLRDVAAVLSARRAGLALPRLNLGNVHYGSGRRQVSASVFLSQDELDQLKLLGDDGVEVEAQGVPSDSPVRLPQLTERFVQGG